MVQLKLAPCHIDIINDTLFQFQYGSIKTTGLIFLRCLICYFNSSMVQLKPVEQR